MGNCEKAVVVHQKTFGNLEESKTQLPEKKSEGKKIQNKFAKFQSFAMTVQG